MCAEWYDFLFEDSLRDKMKEDALAGITLDPLDRITIMLADGLKAITDKLTEFLNAVVTAALDMWELVKPYISWLVNAMTQALGAIWDNLVSGATLVWDWLCDNVLGPIASLLQGFLDWIVQGAQDAAKTAWDFIGQAAPRSPEGGITAALAVGGGVAALCIGTQIGATMIDAGHPFKALGAVLIAQSAMDVIGISAIPRQLLGTYLDVAITRPLVYELNAEFTREIPGPGDLVRFVVREAIPPKDFERQMAFHGYSGKWSDAYWEAHWELVPRGELTELLHRDIIDVDEYTKQLILHDFRPDQVPWLIENTYRLPSRFEAERLMEIADVPDETLEMWLQSDGISAEMLSTYMELVKSRRIIRILTRVETLVRAGLREGYMSEDVFRDVMAQWKFPPRIIEAELQLATLDFDIDTKKDLRAMWIDAFRKGEVDASELTSELMLLGMVPDRVGIVVTREVLRQLPKPKKT